MIIRLSCVILALFFLLAINQVFAAVPYEDGPVQTGAFGDLNASLNSFKTFIGANSNIVGGSWGQCKCVDNNYIHFGVLSFGKSGTSNADTFDGVVSELSKAIQQTNCGAGSVVVILINSDGGVERESTVSFQENHQADGQVNEAIKKYIVETGIRTFYVVVGSHLDPNDAIRQAREINNSGQGFRASVYEPWGSEYYAVVIGEGVDKNSANALKRHAIESGFPSDIYLKPIPR